MDYECYNHSTFTLKNEKADTVAVKGLNTAVQLYNFSFGVALINTDDYAEGEYILQIFKGDEILQQSTLKVKQNLKYAAADYDPRSKSQIILEAIEAYLGGVASHQQRRVKVGDKEIEYSSFDELIKWKEYYQKQVRKEQKKSSSLRYEKLYYRGI